MANWTRVLTLDHGKLEDRSTDFKGFYRTKLDRLMENLPAAQAKDEGNGSDGAICMQMEANGIQRFIGADPTAGEESAMEWVRSSDEFLREKGVTVLGEIGDKRSIAVLKELTQDADAGIAMMAKQCLGEKLY